MTCSCHVIFHIATCLKISFGYFIFATPNNKLYTVKTRWVREANLRRFYFTSGVGFVDDINKKKGWNLGDFLSTVVWVSSHFLVKVNFFSATVFTEFNSIWLKFLIFELRTSTQPIYRVNHSNLQCNSHHSEGNILITNSQCPDTTEFYFISV